MKLLVKLGGTLLDAPESRDRLAAQIAEAKAAGVEATPTVFINGRRLPRINDFVQMVDKESARLGLPPLKPPQAPPSPH